MPRRVTWTRISTPVTPMILLEADFVPTDTPGLISLDGSKGAFEFRGDGSGDVDGADVRLRFHYPKEHGIEAKGVARHIEQELRDAGAVNVTLDPHEVIVTKSRIPELGKTVSLEEKMELYWKSTDSIPDEKTALLLKEGLREIQEELAQQGVVFGVEGRAAPRLKRIRGAGWFKYEKGFDIDFESLPGPLRTFVAPNERGKTLLLQLCGPGLLFGETPNRGSLDDLSRSKDAFLEGVFDMAGDEYVLKQMSNGMARTGKVSLTKNGVSILETGGRKEYAAWSKKNLLPWSVYLALLCKSGVEDDGGRKINIIDMKDGERTEQVLRVLGIEFYEQIAKNARDRASAVLGEIDRVRSRLAEIGDVNTDDLEVERFRLARLALTAEYELKRVEAELAKKRSQGEEVAEKRREYDAVRQRRVEIEARRGGIQAQLDELEIKLTNNRAVEANRTEIEGAVSRDAELTNLIASLRHGESELRVRASEIEGKQTTLYHRERDTKAKQSGLERTIRDADVISATKPEVLLAAQELERLKLEATAIEVELRAKEEVTARLQSEALTGKDGRIANLRDGLTVIANGAREPIGYAASALASDSKAARHQEALPSLLEDANRERLALADDHRKLHMYINSEQRRADQIAHIEAAEKSKAEAERELAKLDMAVFESERAGLSKQIDEVSAALNETRKKIQGFSDERSGLKPLIAKAPRLTTAEANIANYTQQIDGLKSELEGIVIPDLPEEPPTLIDLSPYESAFKQALSSLQSCQTNLAIAERNLEEAKSKERRRQELESEIRELEPSADRWARLGRDFGKDGLQKEEISCAGPALTERTNELLLAGGDTRHEVSIITERLHSDGKRMIPCFHIMVKDNEEGEVKESRRLSDAGKILVGEPISLALVIEGCKRAGIKSPTIFRDEATGVMDVDNGPRYIAELRKFSEILDAEVLYVSQQPAIQELADARIEILPGGELRVS
jgi:hypothetical protein